MAAPSWYISVHDGRHASSVCTQTVQAMDYTCNIKGSLGEALHASLTLAIKELIYIVFKIMYHFFYYILKDARSGFCFLHISFEDIMEYEHLGLLHDIFRRQAKLTPDKVAVVTVKGQSVTFRELDDLTDVLATNLQIKGIVPDSVVGIYMERSLEYVIAYIAILKAGIHFCI